MTEMKSYVARAFLNKLLNDEERKDLRNYERQLRDHPDELKRRSFLMGFEICRRYDLKPEPLIESQMMAMDALYYKYMDMMERKHFEECLRGDREAIVDCNCPVELDALYAWENWAAQQVEQSYNWRMALTVVFLVLTLH